MHASKPASAEHVLQILGDAPGLSTDQLAQVPALGPGVAALLAALADTGRIWNDGAGWRVGPRPTAQSVARRSTADCALRILRSDRNRGWSATELHQEVTKLVKPDRAIEQVLAQLAASGRARKGGEGSAALWYADGKSAKAQPEPAPQPTPPQPSPEAVVHEAPTAEDRARSEVRARVLDAVTWTRGELALTASADAAFASAIVELLGIVLPQAFALHFDQTGLVAPGRDARTAFLTIDCGRVSMVFLTPSSFDLFLETFNPRES